MSPAARLVRAVVGAIVTVTVIQLGYGMVLNSATIPSDPMTAEVHFLSIGVFLGVVALGLGVTVTRCIPRSLHRRFPAVRAEPWPPEAEQSR
jgi:hypothetical protein